MISKKLREALFKEIHKSIEESTETLISDLHETAISYPPGNELTNEEKAALGNLNLSNAAKTGLEKLVADACAYPLFHFFPY